MPGRLTCSAAPWRTAAVTRSPTSAPRRRLGKARWMRFSPSNPPNPSPNPTTTTPRSDGGGSNSTRASTGRQFRARLRSPGWTTSLTPRMTSRWARGRTWAKLSEPRFSRQTYTQSLRVKSQPRRPRRGRSAARTTQTRNFTLRISTAGTTRRWCSWIPSRTARRSSASTPRVTCACGRRSRVAKVEAGSVGTRLWASGGSRRRSPRRSPRVHGYRSTPGARAVL
mmetsp:Transcript_11213/g.52033  ORF Transcript_11213/g.52033 Transcript_11213/m.52033 type:complete len:225 (+) Transcript_11213:3378-4052(+)